MKIGEHVPDLTVTDHKNQELKLSALYQQGCLVLYFYPKDGTPVCTKEACSFRDAYDDFLEAGATVIGVSGDSDSSHSSFASKHDLPFHLVADEDGLLKNTFGIKSLLGIMPERATFVIDQMGIVREIVRSSFSADKHVDESLQLVQKLSAENPI